MKLLDPFEIDDAGLVSSNVPETVPVYSVLTTYAKDELVRDEATHTLWESQVDDNVGHALDDGENWVLAGPTNRWGMFDRKLGTVTESPDMIDVVVTSTGRATGIALFGVEGDEVEIWMTDPIDGEVFNETFPLKSQENVNDFYDYFFAVLLLKPNFYLDGLPPYAGAHIRIQIRNAGSIAKCGNCVIGVPNDLGETEWGTEYGTIDYSKRDPDTFGFVDLKPGLRRPTISSSAELEPEVADEIERILDDRLGQPTVYIVSTRRARGMIYGFVKDRRIRDDHDAFSILSIDLESLA